MTLLQRLSTARVVHAKGSCTLVHPDGSASRLDGDSAALAEAVLELFDRPRSRDEVVAHVRALADAPFDEAVIDDLLGLLQRAGVLAPATSSGSHAGANPLPGLRVVLGVSGAIQAMEAPRMISLLHARGFSVRVAATREARRFVSLPALAALTHHEAASGLWGGPSHPAMHIALAEWAEVVLVYPASATTLSRIARGDCSDLVAAIAIASRAPVILAPSMNEAMLRAPSVARNLETLRDDGFFIVEPSLGVEVADPPDRRARRVGPALLPDHLADVVAAIAGRGGASVPDHDWEAVYAEGAPSPPWETGAVPADLAEALAALPPPRSLLDVGTGLGTLAIHAAERGYRVVATDVSRAAIARARRRAGDLPITFVRDDAADTRLAGAFDIVVDRGVLHVLREGEIPSYAAALGDLVRPGGALLLVSDGEEARADRRTLRLAPEALAARLPAFNLERAARSTLSEDDPGAAWLTVWTRR